MTLPHKRVMQYYFALGLPEEQVLRLLEIDAMPLPTEAEMAEIRFRLDLPENFRAHDRQHEASTGWMRAKKIEGLFRGDAAPMRAFELLRSPAREIIEILLAGGWSHGSIAKYLAESDLGGTTEEAAISWFASLFWAVSEMRLTVLVGSFLPRHHLGDLLAPVLEGGVEEARKTADVILNRLRRERVLLLRQRPVLSGGGHQGQHPAP